MADSPTAGIFDFVPSPSQSRGVQLARKGDMRREDVSGTGSGIYESIGSEPHPGSASPPRPDDDPERIAPDDWDGIGRSIKEWNERAPDSRGPFPSFKDKPNFNNDHPFVPGGQPQPQYEHWRLRSTPTMQEGGSVVQPVQFVPDSERQFTTDQRREFLRNLPTHPLLPPNETLGGIATGRIPGHGHLQGEAQDYLDQLDQHFQNNADKSLQEWWYHQRRWMDHKYGPEGHMRDNDDPENKSHIGIDSGDDKERDWRDRLQPRQYTPQPLPPTTRQRPAPANPGQQQIIPIPPGFMDRPEPEPPPTQMMQRGGPVHNPNDPKQILANISQKYPKLAGYDWSIVDSRGKPGTVPGGQLEFYHADDPSSPTPGKPTIEVFNEKLQGPALEKAIFGDMLHHLPEVDQNWRRMRTNYLSSLTPEQKSIDQQAYQRDQKSYGENRHYDDWMEGSRLDAHIRGRLAPDEQDDWRDSYTGQQHQYLDEMEDYLTGSGQLRQYQHGGGIEDDQDPQGREYEDHPDNPGGRLLRPEELDRTGHMDPERFRLNEVIRGHETRRDREDDAYIGGAGNDEDEATRRVGKSVYEAWQERGQADRAQQRLRDVQEFDRQRKLNRYQEGGPVERDPLPDAVYEGDQFLPLDRAIHGLGEGTNNADVVDRLRHPSYQQLHDDKDLRRGKTRMVPRDDGPPRIPTREWPRERYFNKGGPVTSQVAAARSPKAKQLFERIRPR